MKRALIIRGLIVILLLAILSALGAPVWASDTRTGDTILIPAGTTIDDNLYAAGNTITIDGVIKGNLVAVGAQITINGTVEGNLYAGAQSVIINGRVDDLLATTQAFQLGATAVVTRSIVNFGYSFESKQGSSVQGDLLFFGAQALIAGNVGKDLKGGMNGLELRGTIGRNVDVSLGDSDSSAFRFTTGGPDMPTVGGGLRIAEGAQVGGHLNYEAPKQGRIDSGVKLAQTANWRETTGGDPRGFGGFNGFRPDEFSILSQVQRFITLLLVGLLLIWLAPRWMNTLGETVQAKPLPTLGRGLLVFLLFVLLVILVPIATILLAILFGVLSLSALAWTLVIVGGLSEIGIVVAFALFISYIAQAIISFVIGKWLLARFQPKLAEGRVLPLVVGLLLFVIVTAIPVIGGLVGLVAVLLALGALWRWLRPKRTTVLVTPVVAPTPATT
jgi:cytoskeletal protein CcmA (bactofilin family)